MGSSGQFNCSVNGIDDRNFYLTRSTLFSKSTISCFSSVIVPVFQSAAQALEGNSSSSTSLKAALDGGFGLQWSANSDLCSQCVTSGGQCGYESGSSSFTCFCSDKAYASSCSATQNGSTKGLQIWLKIGIAFSLSFYVKKIEIFNSEGVDTK
ncbi:LEAF RUST 10 DISEASE-RESISTANCE LOCUS RECEPTOR-LIKE PROTEIN KINASE-like 2.7 [Camellia sinensis]|uniref:LEAF RUST 10 DISEASE-RESISTANCE LOCUS RECEPTOR-LIKE PROTEIN KINASE-like 2.7 n=1 Tax=Camellia sinensis TaxID=4442 RepID=UPI0010367C50|nr:LEAF RUST 10 DISEASE-RESISTANCE LOCUS RECEPTOR-LIKE PROTEIN KINASE-like 2.7 [Camellia sinensis]